MYRRARAESSASRSDDGFDSSVWICADAKARLHVWSYDGKHKRLKKAATDEQCFRLMYA